MFISAIPFLPGSGTLARARLWSALYGPFTMIAMSFLCSSEVWRTQFDLLRSTNADLIASKEAFAAENSMTALSGTIIALIAVTSLLLPLADKVHWTARAFWVFSLVAGFFAVYHACSMQRTLGRLMRPQHIRAWLSSGTKPQLERRKSAFGLEITIPSLASLVMLSTNKTLLDLALRSYLVGLGAYLGCLWLRRLEEDEKGLDGVRDDRNIFIVYLVSTGICLLLYAQTAGTLASESSPWSNYLDVYHGKAELNRRDQEMIEPPQTAYDGDDWTDNVMAALRAVPPQRRERREQSHHQSSHEPPGSADSLPGSSQRTSPA